VDWGKEGRGRGILFLWRGKVCAGEGNFPSPVPLHRHLGMGHSVNNLSD